MREELCPTLQMWKLKLRGCSWPGRGSAGFGSLALLALKFVHSTTWPLVQSDIFCSQGLTLFIVVHTHTSPCLPPLVTCCTHTAKQTHSELNPSVAQAAPGLRYCTAEHHRAEPQHRPWGTTRAFQAELFLVNSGASEQPQVRLNILLVLPRALATTPLRSCWHGAAQGNATRLGDGLGSSLYLTCKCSNLGQVSTPPWPWLF